jgi:hypothetical protein
MKFDWRDEEELNVPEVYEWYRKAKSFYVMYHAEQTLVWAVSPRGAEHWLLGVILEGGEALDKALLIDLVHAHYAGKT